MNNSCCMMLWEDLIVWESNWGDVSGLFAGELPSLKKLNMHGCENLEKTDSMESIGMTALGTLFHVPFDEEFLLYDVIRGSKCSIFQLGGRQRSICGRVVFFEEIADGWMWKFKNGFYGLYWNESVGYSVWCFICWFQLILDWQNWPTRIFWTFLGFCVLSEFAVLKT